MKTRRYLLAVVLASSMVFSCKALFAATEEIKETGAQSSSVTGSATALPVQYAFVNGNTPKFRALQWTRQEYTGGVEDAAVAWGSPDDVQCSMDGGGIINNGDYKGNFLLEKKDWGSVRFYYDQFRKYYDNRGGVYYPFSTGLSGRDLQRELSMDIGKFGVETILKREDFPELKLAYEREYRKGQKSLLAWASATDRKGLVRKVAPAWFETDERVDNFEIGVEHEYKGYRLKAEELFEIVHMDNRRYEQNISNSTTASDGKIRIQTLKPQTTLLQTNVFLDKWFLNDSLYSSGYYNFSKLDNQEKENFREYTGGMVPWNFGTFAEQKIDAFARNEMNKNSWVLNLSSFPAKWIAFIGKVKADVWHRNGSSAYPADDNANAAPNGVIDHTEYSVTDQDRQVLAESFSIRFKAIPKTSIYTEGQLVQTTDRLTSDRDSVGPSLKTGEKLYRRTDSWIGQGDWVIGASIEPCRYFTTTHQFRYRVSNTDYDQDRRVTGSDSVPAWFDSLNTRTAEVKSRFTAKPASWVQTSFRYVFFNTDYLARTIPDQSNNVTTNMSGNDFIYDVTVTPRSDLFLTGSFTQQQQNTRTAKNTLYMPMFQSGYDTWLFNANYVPTQKINLNSNVYYTRARNFNDFTAVGLPLGAAFDKVGVSCSLRWTLDKKNETYIEPYYAFDSYQPNPHYDASQYTANTLAVRASVKFG